MANVVSIVISANNRANSAMTSAELRFRRMANNMRQSWNRAMNAFVMRGGVAGSINRLQNRFRSLANSIQAATRAMIAYAITTRIAQGASDRMAKALTGMIGPAVMIGAKFVAILAVALPLIGVVGNLLGAVQLVAPAAATGALAMGVLKLATQGFADAVKAGLEGDTEEFNKLLKGLAPNAALAAKMVIQIRDAYRGLQQAVQNNFFSGAAGDMGALAGAAKPLADKWLPKIATSFADMRHAVADVIFTFLKSADAEAVFRNLSLAIDDLTRMAAPLSRVFLDVLDVAAPRFEQLTSSAATLVEKFADWVHEMKESGKLTEWLDKALHTMDQLKTIAGNVMGIFQALFQASSDDGDDFLQTLIQITEQFEQWLKSADGQQIIDLFAELTQLMIGSAPIWAFLLGFVSLTIAEFKVLGTVGGYIWTGLVGIVKFFVAMSINAFGLFLMAAAAAFGWIPGIGPKLKKAEADFRSFAQNVNNSLNNINDKHVVVTVERKLLGPALGGYFGYRGLATGGIGSGKTVVGENGAEVVDWNKRRVFSHGHSKRLMNDQSGASGTSEVNIVVASSSGAKDWFAEMFLEMIRRSYIQIYAGGKRVQASP